MGMLKTLLTVVMVTAATVGLAAEGRFKIAYATYLGGNDWEEAREIIAYPNGSALFGAHVCSSGLPTTAGCFQPNDAGDDPTLGHGGFVGGDLYLARLSSDGGEILAATCFGGSKQERSCYAMERDSQGNIVIACVTRSADAPTTPGAFQREQKGRGDGFVTKLSDDGKRFVFSTRLGGTGGENLLMPTVDEQGNICVVGSTSSRDFPVTPDARHANFGGGEGDGLLTVLSPDGSQLLYATYLGGSGDETIRSMTFGPRGEVYLVGTTSSPDFPTTPGGLQPKLTGNDDAFVVKLVVR